MVKIMTVPIKNTVFEKIKENESLTDSELSKTLIKDGIVMAEDRFNKLLLDLEILGLIKVTWLTKDTRRIEVVTQKEELDEVDLQNKEAMEKDYEASFPGADN
jgi:hypothetical protein